jgi:hypothetical protein
MKELLKTIAQWGFFIVISVIILGYIFGQDAIIDHYKTVQIDTTYVQLPPDTTKEHEALLAFENANNLNLTLRDSLENANNSIETLYNSVEYMKEVENEYLAMIDSIEAGHIPVAKDQVTFDTGDSLETKYYFPPLNIFKYSFFPAPRMEIATTETDVTVIDTTPLLTLHLGAGLSYDASSYKDDGNIKGIAPELFIGLSFNKPRFMPYFKYTPGGANSLGIAYNIHLFGKKYNPPGK